MCDMKSRLQNKRSIGKITPLSSLEVSTNSFKVFIMSETGINSLENEWQSFDESFVELLFQTKLNFLSLKRFGLVMSTASGTYGQPLDYIFENVSNRSPRMKSRLSFPLVI